MKRGVRRTMNKRILSFILSVVMIVTLIPAVAFAQTDSTENNDQDEIEQSILEELKDQDQPSEEKIISQVTLTCASNVKSTQGGTIEGMQPGQTTSFVTLANGETREFAITPGKGFRISKVIVNGKSIGIVNKVSLTGNGEAQSIYVKFKKQGLFIMLDAGHAGHYNRGIIRKYWESKMTWKLTNYLKKELESYGIVCGMTKKSQKHDPGVYERGLKAKGYDLFISIHSNYSDARGTDYPLAIVSSKHKKKLYKKAQPLGKKLVKTIRSTMKTRQRYQVWVKRQNDGRDWYGVIRGSAAVNVPGIILEHSFHSNRSKCKWLLKNKNLRKMAAAEAKTIAEHYGYGKQ